MKKGIVIGILCMMALFCLGCEAADSKKAVSDESKVSVRASPMQRMSCTKRPIMVRRKNCQRDTSLISQLRLAIKRSPMEKLQPAGQGR